MVLLLSLAPFSSQAQETLPRIQAGIGGLPGVGMQGGFVPQRTFYTIETTLYVHYRPELMGGEHNWLVAGGVGGALRIMGAIDFVRDRPSAYDIDVGLRLGPGLQFKPDETLAERNRRFYLFLEPFARYAFRLQGGPILFAEVGTQQPYLRTGLWLDL